MPNCRYVKEKLIEFIDNELSIDDTNKVLEHLAICEKCQAKVDKQLKLRDLLRKNFEKTPPSFSFKLDKKIFKCFEVENKIVEFEDGGLNQEERKTISAHLLECKDCRLKYDKLKKFNAQIRYSLYQAPFEKKLNIKEIVIDVVCENKKNTIFASTAIASCIMFVSLVSFNSIDKKELTEVSFKKEEVAQEKPEQIVLKDINEKVIEDSQKLIYEVK